MTTAETEGLRDEGYGKIEGVRQMERGDATDRKRWNTESSWTIFHHKKYKVNVLDIR